jgi:hypothetical protein
MTSIFLFKSWATQNVITIKTSWNTNDYLVSNLLYYYFFATEHSGHKKVLDYARIMDDFRISRR